MQGRLSGFSLVELLVVLILAFIMVTLGLPILLSTVRQAKLRGITQDTEVLMRRARLDAVKTSAQAVVRIVPSVSGEPGRVEAFSDRNGDKLLTAGEPMLGSLSLPTDVRFKAPGNLLNAASVRGFSPDPVNSSFPPIAVFQGTGGIEKVGAFRFADSYENYLEVSVDPAATARVEVRKARDEGGSWNWYASGDGTSGEGWIPWEWH